MSPQDWPRASLQSAKYQDSRQSQAWRRSPRARTPSPSRSRDRRGDRPASAEDRHPGGLPRRPACRRPPGTGGTGSARRRRSRPRSRTLSGSSRGRWPPPNGRRSWTCCTASGSLTWPRTKSGRRCSTRAPTSARSPPTTGSSRGRRKPGAARAGHPSRRRQARAGGHRTEPGLVLGHHQAARPGEMDLLPPVRDPRHLQPLRGRLDGRHPRVRRPGREAHRRDLRQAGHRPRAAHPPRRPRHAR